MHRHLANIAFLVSKHHMLLLSLQCCIFCAYVRLTIAQRWEFAILIIIADLIEVVNFLPDCVLMRSLDYSTI